MSWVFENLFWGGEGRTLVELTAGAAPLRAAPELLSPSAEAAAATATVLGLGGLPLPALWPASRWESHGARHGRDLLEERASLCDVFVAAF